MKRTVKTSARFMGEARSSEETATQARALQGMTVRAMPAGFRQTHENANVARRPTHSRLGFLLVCNDDGVRSVRLRLVRRGAQEVAARLATPRFCGRPSRTSLGRASPRSRYSRIGVGGQKLRRPLDGLRAHALPFPGPVQKFGLSRHLRPDAASAASRSRAETQSAPARISSAPSARSVPSAVRVATCPGILHEATVARGFASHRDRCSDASISPPIRRRSPRFAAFSISDLQMLHIGASWRECALRLHVGELSRAR